MANIFLSYSRKDEEWRKKIFLHMNVLNSGNNKVHVWSDRDIDLGDEWYPEIVEAINLADIVILLVSPNFLNSSFVLRKEIPLILERKNNNKTKIIPLQVRPCVWDEVSWISKFQVYPDDNIALSSQDEHGQDFLLSEFTRKVAALIKSCTAKKNNLFICKKNIEVNVNNIEKIDNAFHGRTNELNALDFSLNSDSVNLLIISAWGGSGKTSLVNNWIEKITGCDEYDIDIIYAWSFSEKFFLDVDEYFYSETFFRHIFAWLGVNEEVIPKSNIEKGTFLAKALLDKKILLILDGLESLQFSSNINKGLIKDNAIKSLINQLATYNSGLCVITTKEEIKGLPINDDRIFRIKLEHLDELSCIKVLRDQGVKGKECQLLHASQNFHCHALSVVLLGRYLKSFHHGNIESKDKILEAFAVEKNKAFSYVVNAYSYWLQGQPELDLIALIALFPESVEYKDIDTIVSGEVIDDLTSRIFNLNYIDFVNLANRLIDMGVLTDKKSINKNSYAIHPVFKEYFCLKIRKENYGAWVKVNKRLCNYYLDSSSRFDRSNANERNLFYAMELCCKANEYNKAFQDIYWSRIHNERPPLIPSLFPIERLEDDLNLLSNFYYDNGRSSIWKRIRDELSPENKKEIMSLSSSHLISLGRYFEAIFSLEAQVRLYRQSKSWSEVAKRKIQSSELMLITGSISDSISVAEDAIDYSDRSDVPLLKIDSRVSLATTYYFSGDHYLAKTLFDAALNVQKKQLPGTEMLGGMSGFKYFYFILSSKEKTNSYESSLKRNIYFESSPLVKSMLYMLLGSFYIHKKILISSEVKDAGRILKDSLSRIRVQCERRPQLLIYLPMAMLNYAIYLRVSGLWRAYESLMDELFSLVECSSMILYNIDYNIERGRYYIERGNFPLAVKSIAQARKLTEESGAFQKEEEILFIEEKIEACLYG